MTGAATLDIYQVRRNTRSNNRSRLSWSQTPHVQTRVALVISKLWLSIIHHTKAEHIERLIHAMRGRYRSIRAVHCTDCIFVPHQYCV